jgi:Raf kinase inhibitor-like YbhB/YbcL family protein
MLRTIAAGLLAATLTGASFKFELKSTDVKAGKEIPMANVFNGMGCTGQNKSPALEWTGAPSGTKSFAVTMYDPDAPTGSGWWHWVIYNIPATTTSMAQGAGDAGTAQLPTGAFQGLTDFGTPGYGGPCPPAGSKDHHYTITVYALNDAHLDIAANMTPAYVSYIIRSHSIAKASLTAVYKR